MPNCGLRTASIDARFCLGAVKYKVLMEPAQLSERAGPGWLNLHGLDHCIEKDPFMGNHANDHDHGKSASAKHGQQHSQQDQSHLRQQPGQQHQQGQNKASNNSADSNQRGNQTSQQNAQGGSQSGQGGNR